jgi:hypothetical protein
VLQIWAVLCSPLTCTGQCMSFLGSSTLWGEGGVGKEGRWEEGNGGERGTDQGEAGEGKGDRNTCDVSAASP